MRIKKFLRAFGLIAVQLLYGVPVLAVLFGVACFAVAGAIALAVYVAARAYIVIPELGGSMVVMLTALTALALVGAARSGALELLRRGAPNVVGGVRVRIKKVVQFLLTPVVAAERKFGYDL